MVSKLADDNIHHDRVVNVSAYDDVNELYLIADVLVTDYSSVFFDYSKTGKPIFLYMYDLDTYQNKLRGFYFDIEELPGPIVQTEDELIKAINNLSLYNEVYGEKYKLLQNKYTYLDDGKASERVVQRLLSL